MTKVIQVFDTVRAENRLDGQNYRCEVQDGLVIVQDPYYNNGIIVGYNEITLRTEDDLVRFFANRL
jgi:hypothetical protein